MKAVPFFSLLEIAGVFVGVFSKRFGGVVAFGRKELALRFSDHPLAGGGGPG